MSVAIRDPRFVAVVGDAVQFECLGESFLFTEGPAWDARTQRLIFSDIPGDTMYQWSHAGGVQIFRQPSNKANGLTWDRAGRLLSCEHATSRVTRLEPDGALTVLASHYEGKELNSPNDIVVRHDGAIYFSDPTYGRLEYFGVPRAPQLGFRGVYRVDCGFDSRIDGGANSGVGSGTDATGAPPALLADDFAQPNGLCFSADERELFVNDTERMHIRVFGVRADGSLDGGGVWATLEGPGDGAPDGMKFDSAGNLYCCGPGGIHVFDTDARCLGVIRVPRVAANFTWGEDGHSLFITASEALYRIRVRVPGIRVRVPG